ncbi:elongation of very long chain fatty acids protein AAEL008004 [Ixodes scapularis]|uniref:elongation of very long chain fatty acids protein AAEL008004 n=1 Tax=Ixodes scapularis TaxID=6945 RepID=UPI001A9EBE3E|nr:elongation of very long chain fatty acids protein AAEL008004 [Ixodes scapularis]XP_040079686.1 elongation of very long chain fatty acids protein AAEL008004 [Ixodes scapularis]
MINVSMNPITFLNEIHKRGDPRTRDYPLVVNPFFVFPLILGYLYFVKVAGPRWMKNREPFEITNIVRFYNLCMVAVNARFLYIVLKNTYLPGGRYSLWCQGITGYMDEELTEYYKGGWFFVAVRYVDLLDTVFCVLRKKFRQITHLHVIHHVIVATNVWFWTLFAPEGQVALGLAINVFVHVIMYSYYFLATLGPGVQKYLWWKKYLTTLQIIQFGVSILHLSIPLFVDCGFPKYLIVLGNLQTFLILCLFVNFFVHTYKREGPSIKSEKSSAVGDLHQNVGNVKPD